MPKPYEQVVQFVVKSCTEGARDLRYVKFAACMVIAEAYEKDYATVQQDISNGLDAHAKEQRAKQKAAHRAANEERRLANLAKQAEQS